MNRPVPTWAYHFTHVDNLPGIMRDGLVCDSQAHDPDRLAIAVGNLDIKARRRQRRVDVAPGGVVADYVPFYFGRRGPMLYNIHSGWVPTYADGQAGLVYLCTTLERVIELGLLWVASSRNAATDLAVFTTDLRALDTHVDWQLIGSRSFRKTESDPDRPQRHQAELLVHRRLPWGAVMFVGARNDADLERVLEQLGGTGSQPQAGVRGRWYFN